MCRKPSSGNTDTDLSDHWQHQLLTAASAHEKTQTRSTCTNGPLRILRNRLMKVRTLFRVFFTVRTDTSCSEMCAPCQVQQKKKKHVWISVLTAVLGSRRKEKKKTLQSHWKMILNGYWLQKVERVTACDLCDPQFGFGFVLRPNCSKLF